MDIRSILCYKNPLLDSTSTLSNHSNSLLFFAEKLLKNVVFTFPTPLLPFSLEPTLIKLSPSALVKVPSDLHVASSRGQFSVINLPNLSAAFDIADLSLLLVHFLHLAPVASTSPDFIIYILLCLFFHLSTHLFVHESISFFIYILKKIADINTLSANTSACISLTRTQ